MHEIFLNFLWALENTNLLKPKVEVSIYSKNSQTIEPKPMGETIKMTQNM